MAYDSAAESEQSQGSLSSHSQKFVPQEDDEETLWEVIEITGEKGNTYKVRWKGNDPKTMKPWPQSWVAKTDCTDDLVKEWKRKQRRTSTKSGRASTASRKTGRAATSTKNEQPVASTSKATRRSTSTVTAKPAPKSGRSSATTARNTGTVTPRKRDLETTDDEVGDIEEEERHKSRPKPSGYSKPKGKKRKLDEATSAHNSANHLSGGDPVNEDKPTSQRAAGRPRKKRKVVVEVAKIEPESEDDLPQSLMQPQQDSYEVRKVRSTALIPPEEDNEEEEVGMIERALSEVDDSPQPDDDFVQDNNAMHSELSSPDHLSLYRPSSSAPAPAPSPLPPPPPVKIGPPKKHLKMLEKLSRGSKAKAEVSHASSPKQLSHAPETSSERAFDRQPTEERSIFWDGGVEDSDRVPEPILSPAAKQRLEQFDEDVMGIPRKQRRSQVELDDEEEVEIVEVRTSTSEAWFVPDEASSLIRGSPSKSKSTNPSVPQGPLVVQAVATSSKSSNMSIAGAQTFKANPQSTAATTTSNNDPLPHRSANPPTHSYDNDIVPETDESQSQELELPAQPATVVKLGVQSNAKQRTSEKPEERPALKQKPLRPIPQLSPSTFHPHLPESSLPESITNSEGSIRRQISENEELEEPMSSIEQFDSPAKLAKKPTVIVGPVDRKGKGKAMDTGRVKESASDVWESGVVKRGQEIAELAKKRRDARSKSPSARPKKTVDEIIAHTRSRSRSGSNLSHAGSGNAIKVPTPIVEDIEEEQEEEEDMAEASTAVMPPASGPYAMHDEHLTLEGMENAYVDLSGGTEETQADVDIDGPPQQVDPLLLRHEEEESTQDVMMDFQQAQVEGQPVSLPTRGVRPKSALPPIDEGESSDPNAHGERPDAGEDSDSSLKVPQIVVQNPSRATSVRSYSTEEDRLPVGRMTRSRSRSQTPAVTNRPNGKEKRGKSSAPSTKRGSVPPTCLPAIENELNAQKSLLAKLEVELASTRTMNAGLLEEVQALRPQVADLKQALDVKHQESIDQIATAMTAATETWIEERAELTRKLAAAEKAKVDAEKDREFFRDQYAQASGFVSQVRDENKDIEKRIKIAEEQTKHGVSLVKATFELRLKTLDDDLKAWRKMANFLIEKDRRSNNEDICRRAALEPELRAQCARQIAELGDAEERIHELETELDDKTLGLIRTEEELDEYKRQATQLHVDLNEALLKLDHIGRAGDSDDGNHDTVGNGHEFVYSCKWRTGDQNQSCREVFSTVLELEQHLLSAEGHVEIS